MNSPGKPGFWFRGGEEGVFERTAKTYFLSLVALLVATLAAALWFVYAPQTWWVSCSALACLLLLVGRLFGGDAVLAVWWRWPVVAKDVGLIANETGVPDLLWVTANSHRCSAMISALALPTMDAIEMEDRIARGFGYRAGVVTEVPGRVRKSRARWKLDMFRDNVMESVIPVQYQGCVDVNVDPVFLGCDKTIQPIAINLMDTAGHWVIQGATRSGKTAFIYGVLAQVASMRNVVCRIVDPTGIIALPFNAFDHRSVAPEPGTNGEDRLQKLADFLAEEVSEMDLRIAELSRNWQDKLEEATPERPLRLIVIEEYAGVLLSANAEDAATGRKRAQTSSRIEAAVARLTAEGAKAAIRLVLMTPACLRSDC